ncbi:MAG: mycofactocin biosynthesis peptidyl-dipeptidase MftE [Actinobacteria bacterium]|nr:mycofactocin biosynthesis peptidyl-dipeptidase MftE [Actinomycetota bacterium]
MRLADLPWPAVAERAARSLLAVPVGSTEQHGPHLPLDTDTRIARALADRLAAARSSVLVAPAVPYGSSGEHAGFPGTLSIGQAATEAVLVELVRSADAFAGVVLVSAHGGNAEAVHRAVRTLAGEKRPVLAWAPGGEPEVLGRGEGPPSAAMPPADAHAGRTETSLLLALDAGSVHLALAEAGDVRPLPEILPDLRAGGVAAVSPNGVLGDPAGATAAEGEALLATMTASLVAAVDRFAGAPLP